MSSLESALRASLEDDDLEEGSDSTQEGPKSADAIVLQADSIVGLKEAESPQELIEAAVQGEEVAANLDEVADKADEIADNDDETEVSAEMLTMNLQHVLQPLHLSNTVTSFEGARDLKQYHRQLAVDCRAQAEGIRRVARELRMRPSMENKYTYFFKTNKSKIEEATKRIAALKQGLSNKIEALNEHPAAFNHTGIALFMSMDDKVVHDPVRAFEESTKVLEGLFNIAVKDATALFRNLNRAIGQSKGDGEAVLSHVVKVKNPASSMAVLLNGTGGKSIMGNTRIIFKENGGLKNVASGSWTIRGYATIRRSTPLKETQASKWWFLVAGVGATLSGGSLAAAGAAGGAAAALFELRRGSNHYTTITTNDLKRLIADTDKLMGFIRHAMRDDTDTINAYIEAHEAMEKISLRSSRREISEILEISHDAYESAASVVINRGLYLVGSVLQLAEHAILKTR